MEHLDDKYFIPFPEFFTGKEWDSEVYLGPGMMYKDVYVVANIIFTRTGDLEEIKKAAKEDWEGVQEVPLDPETKLALQKIHDKLCNDEPREARFKLEFKTGDEGYDFVEKEAKLTIFVDSDKLPDPKEIFFFAADTY